MNKIAATAHLPNLEKPEIIALASLLNAPGVTGMLSPQAIWLAVVP